MDKYQKANNDKALKYGIFMTEGKYLTLSDHDHVRKNLYPLNNIFYHGDKML